MNLQDGDTDAADRCYSRDRRSDSLVQADNVVKPHNLQIGYRMSHVDSEAGNSFARYNFSQLA